MMASYARQVAGACVISTYLMILSTCELAESFQYCLLAVFKCLLNTVFGRSAECSNEMWEMCDFIMLCSHNRPTLSLAACPWKCKFGELLLPLWNSVQRECLLCMAGRARAPVVRVNACMCIHGLIGYAFFPLLLIRSFCPQVRVWLLIPWAALLLNLQHMIHNRSPVKLNHSLLWPLINIQWTKSLSWSASSQIYCAFSCLYKMGVPAIILWRWLGDWEEECHVRLSPRNVKVPVIHNMTLYYEKSSVTCSLKIIISREAIIQILDSGCWKMWITKEQAAPDKRSELKFFEKNLFISYFLFFFLFF